MQARTCARSARICTVFAAAAAAAVGGSAHADLSVRFVESAPTDRFEIENTGLCPIGRLTVTIDLAGSAAGLLFDTTGAGAGVQVFQPLRIAQGEERVERLAEIADGDQILSASLTGLSPGEAVVLTIDVDDTLAAGPRGQTQIAGSEIEGAAALISFEDADIPGAAAFAADGRALIAAPGCVS